MLLKFDLRFITISLITVGLIYYLHEILLSVFLATVIAYAMYPLCNLLNIFISRIPYVRKFSWNISCIFTLMLVIVSIIVLLLFCLPFLTNHTNSIIAFLRKVKSEDILFNISNMPFKEKFDEIYYIIKPHVNMIVQVLLTNVMQLAQQLSHKTVPFILSFASSLHNLFYLLLIFIMSFYILRDWCKWQNRIDSLLSIKYVKKYKPFVMRSINRFSFDMKKWIVGQVVISNVMSLYYASVFFFLGFTPILGLVFGYASIIPYLGDFLCFFLLGSEALISSISLSKTLLAFILIMIGHLISGHFLTPILIGSYTGLIPVYIIFGLMLNTHLLGLIGLILNIPICLIIKSLFISGDSTLILEQKDNEPI